MKRMKKRKYFASLCVAICLILSLTACGGSQKAPESGTSVEKDSQTSSGQESVPAEAATQDEAVDAAASAAFSWYLENKNEGRPIVLAGFSQGADMCYRILEEYFGDTTLQQQLVAVSAIGWPMTEEMITEYPQIRPAASENDTGVVVSFECESEDVTGLLSFPKT